MMRPLSLLTILALALCLCSLSTPTDAQVFCRNGVCYNVGQRAANFVRGTAYNAGSFVASAPVRRGLFGRRAYTRYSDYSYGNGSGSAGNYGATSYGSSGDYGAVSYSQPMTIVESPYAESATATTTTKATTQSTGGCNCAERWEKLEDRLQKLEEPWNVPLGEASQQPAAWEKKISSQGKLLNKTPKWEQMIAGRGKPLSGSRQLIAMK